MIRISKTLGSLLLAAMLIVGCGKGGDPGPEGPQGEKGEKGDAGSVDIIYSDWLQLDWNLNNSSSYLAHSLEVSELTPEFIENGGILLMFLKDGDYIYSIPFSAGNDFVYYTISLPSELLIYVGTTDGSGVELFFKEGAYRYILIPGGTSNINGRPMSIDLTNYAEVRKYYNLPD